MMRGVSNGMPIKAVGVTLQQSPMAFIYRADAARPTKISEIKGSRIAITAGDASLAIFTAFMGKLGMKRSEEHTSELQSHLNLVCRLLLEKKNSHSSIITQDA